MTPEEALDRGREDAAKGRSRTHRRNGLVIWLTLFAGPAVAALVIVNVVMMRQPTGRAVVLLAVLVPALVLVWRTRVVVGPAGLRIVNFTDTVEIPWDEVAGVDVQASPQVVMRLQVLTIERVGAAAVPAYGVMRMWSGLLGPGSAQVTVARRVWGRWLAERERRAVSGGDG